MLQKAFENLLDDLSNVKRLPISKDVHWDGDNHLNNGYNFYGKEVRSQYISRISSPLGFSLGRIINKLDGIGPVDDEYAETIADSTIFPDRISDSLIRLGELTREDNSLFGFFDNNSKRMYGIVSDKHTYIPDKVVYNTITKFLDHLGEMYLIDYDHNIYSMRMTITFPDLELEIGRGDTLHYSVAVTNSAFGFRSLGWKAGFYRVICGNGAIIGKIDVSYTQDHRLKSEKLMLTNLVGAMSESFNGYEKYSGLVREAAEISADYISEETSLERWLPDNFDIKVKEAQEIFKVMKVNNFPNTSFWIGQGAAEVARDKTLDDRERLEIIAGQLMFAQVIV